MNVFDIILLVMICGAAFGAFRFLIRKQKEGGCAGCSGCYASCGIREQKKAK